jgi:hypothetical protein
MIIISVYFSTGDVKLIEPDPLSEGFTRYAACSMEHHVFEFLLNYVRLIKNGMAIWDQAKRLQENPNQGEKKAMPDCYSPKEKT